MLKINSRKAHKIIKLFFGYRDVYKSTVILFKSIKIAFQSFTKFSVFYGVVDETTNILAKMTRKTEILTESVAFLEEIIQINKKS